MTALSTITLTGIGILLSGIGAILVGWAAYRGTRNRKDKP